MKTLTPEQKLRNVAKILKKYATPTRQNAGGRYSPNYGVDKHTIASTALQLAEMVEAYLDGELNPSIVDEIPF